MGSEQSTAVEASEGSSFGFRVLGIQENSPSSSVGFVSFFDFIIAANGIRLDMKDATFMEIIAQSEDQPMKLNVYNVKSQTTRELEMTPSRNWPGKGMLGVTIRFDSYEGAEDHLLHVLEVAENSPAYLASLEPDADYLLGTHERVFRDPEDLYDEILDNLDKPLQCYVYNAKTDQVRLVTIVPNDRWGGEGFGFLGAEVGHGYLHRLPEDVRNSNGESVGFVNIAAHTKAATDVYAREAPSSIETPSAPEEVVVEESSESSGEVPDEVDTAAVEEPVDCTQVQREVVEKEIENQTVEAVATQAKEPTQAKVVTPKAVTPPKSNVSTSSFPPLGFPGFPISTVETYIDPMSHE
ncbi:golgi reassembly-stacking protein [Thraustotheca clavata]|uniref:Golgi reassembly-stacking protein n=1 Tax=Thraustotheca clavata TaxID=74557 RepID=A0A1V9ZCH6_9STRA|nr:golgi reassembly-stacking protein [Thraustotheca clavata]